MTPHPGETRLNDYVDGLLLVDEARTLEAHLATCDTCRRRVERLRDLVGELRALPPEIAPPRDLRPPVTVARAGATSSGDDASRAETARHLTLLAWSERRESQAPTASDTAGCQPARRAPWLRAAAAIFALLGAVWLVWYATDGRDRGAATAGHSAAGAAAAVAAVVPLEPYANATRDLLAAFRARRSELAPDAVRLIQRNLAVVDAAIRELERARARAPGDAALSRLLEERYRTKLELLRDAVALISKA